MNVSLKIVIVLSGDHFKKQILNIKKKHCKIIQQLLQRNSHIHCANKPQSSSSPISSSNFANQRRNHPDGELPYRFKYNFYHFERH